MGPASGTAGILEPGEVVAGKYVVEGKIASGGMGIVYRARHPGLGHDVALKVLRPDFAEVPEAVKRFAREARAAARIRGERVVRIYDVGTLDDGIPFMVMELLEGHDLGTILGACAQLEVALAADYVVQTCEALAQAHAVGIVHRDLKPQNVFVTSRPDGTPLVKLVDFGISKVPPSAGRSRDVTDDEALLGTPSYMSPEQLVSAKTVDARSDIWALGIMMYRMLAGATPFDATSMPELCARILTTPVPPLASKRPDLSLKLTAIVHKCLEREPGSRFQDVAELSRNLVPFAPERSRDVLRQIEAIVAGRASLPAEPPSSSSLLPVAEVTATILDPPALLRASRRMRAAMVLGTLGGVTVALAAAVAMSRTSARVSEVSQASQAGETPGSVPPSLPSASADPASGAASPVPSAVLATLPSAAPTTAPASSGRARRGASVAAHPTAARGGGAERFPTER